MCGPRQQIDSTVAWCEYDNNGDDLILLLSCILYVAGPNHIFLHPCSTIDLIFQPSYGPLECQRTDLVDPTIKYYWCRTRVRGVKKLKKSEALDEQVEASGTGTFALSGDQDAMPAASGLGLQTSVAVEAQKTQASKRLHFSSDCQANG